MTIEEPYVRARHQIANFVRFCETVLKISTVRTIKLVAGYDEETDLAELQDKLGELSQSLLELYVVLDIELKKTLELRPLDVDGLPVVAESMVNEVHQSLDGDVLAVAKNNTFAASIPEAFGQLSKVGIGNR